MLFSVYYCACALAGLARVDGWCRRHVGLLMLQHLRAKLISVVVRFKLVAMDFRGTFNNNVIAKPLNTMHAVTETHTWDSCSLAKRRGPSYLIILTPPPLGLAATVMCLF